MFDRLSPADLICHTDPKTLPRKAHYQPLFGQYRATNAITTACHINAPNYHIIATGDSPLDKAELITLLLQNISKNYSPPSDWVYLHNTECPSQPLAIALPTGQAHSFAHAIERLYLTCQKKLQRRLNSQRYRLALMHWDKRLCDEEMALIGAFNEQAKKHHVKFSAAVWRKNYQLLPELLPEVMPELLEAIDPACAISEQAAQALSADLKKLAQQLHDAADKSDERLEAWHKSWLEATIKPLFDEFLAKAAVFNSEANTPDQANATSKRRPKFWLNDYLSAYYEDLLQQTLIGINDGDFTLHSAEKSTAVVPARFAVNVAASNDCVPIVRSHCPSVAALFGSIEYTSQNGFPSADLSTIRPGDLHRANGGFLLIDAADLLDYPFAWQGLKQALRSGQLRIFQPEPVFSSANYTLLEPQAVALNVKVILLASTSLYYELMGDDDWREIFGVRADFASDVARDCVSEQVLAGNMQYFIKQNKLLPFTSSAIAAILDHLAQLCGKQNRLSLSETTWRALLLESELIAKNEYTKSECSKNDFAQADFVHALPCPNFSAKKIRTKKISVQAADVHFAIKMQRQRQQQLQEWYWQELINGQQLIATRGAVVGQVNALSVIDDGEHAFGMPARITARLAPKFGTGEIIDIERETQLGGNIHSKAVLIMVGFLRGLFSERYALNFTASLVFEQSYGEIDGDSATLAKSCALLSALANVPLQQNFAITGSMNQFGQVQAVGGINEKISAFFRACCIQEPMLTALNEQNAVQGVIIPRVNAGDLMLDAQIIAAVQAGQFCIITVDHVFDALQLLTGLPVTFANSHGKFAQGTLLAKAAKRLKQWTDDNKRPRKKPSNKSGKKLNKKPMPPDSDAIESLPSE